MCFMNTLSYDKLKNLQCLLHYIFIKLMYVHRSFIQSLLHVPHTLILKLYKNIPYAFPRATFINTSRIMVQSYTCFLCNNAHSDLRALLPWKCLHYTLRVCINVLHQYGYHHPINFAILSCLAPVLFSP